MASGCGGAVELSCHLWWHGLRGVWPWLNLREKEQREREREGATAVKARSDCGLLW